MAVSHLSLGFYQGQLGTVRYYRLEDWCARSQKAIEHTSSASS